MLPVRKLSAQGKVSFTGSSNYRVYSVSVVIAALAAKGETLYANDNS